MSLTATNRITEFREAISQALESIQYPVKVLLGPSEFDEKRGVGMDRLNFLVRITVGEPNDAAESAIDELIDQVGDQLALDATLQSMALDVFVSRCSGHRLFAMGQADPPTLGAEWTVNIKVS